MSFILGTAVKITAVMDETPDSAKISIFDPLNRIKITLANMTNEGSNTYSYIYQSSTANKAGGYMALVKGTKGIYTSYSKIAIELL